MEHAYATLTQLLTAHPAWTLCFVFAAAFLEALALIGTFVPGSVAMFVAGAFVGTGAVDLGWLLFWAVAGAVAGDGFSYWLGRRYRTQLRQIWPFRTHPGLLAGAEKFFDRHGMRSVILARFIGPLRALVPVVAGMTGMAPLRFFVMNVVSALIWAPAHIVPGVVFGASLELAGAVSFRLVAILVVLTGLGWVAFHMSRLFVMHVETSANALRGRVEQWIAAHPGHTSRRLQRLIDPAQPGLGLAVALTGFAPLGAVLFSYLLANVLRGSMFAQIDASVLQFLRAVHTTWADALLARVETLGSPLTLGVLAAAITLWMALERRWRNVAYWLAAMLASQLLLFVLRIAIRHAPAGDANLDAYLFPSDRVSLIVLVYGFLMFLLIRRTGFVQSIMVGTLGNLIVTGVTLAGLYFGRYLVSDALGGIAFAWVAITCVVLTAMWRYPAPPRRRPFMPAVFLAVLCASMALQPPTQRPLSTATSPSADAAAQANAARSVTLAAWRDVQWRHFACYRTDMRGDRREPITLQWAASAADLAHALNATGWRPSVAVTAHGVLSLVSPQVDVMSLPVLPKLNNGVPSALMFARRAGPDREHGDRRDVLRFWPSGYALSDGAGEPVPIWLGAVTHERLRHPSWPFNILATYTEPDTAATAATEALAQPGDWRTVTMPGGPACDDNAIVLIAPPAH